VNAELRESFDAAVTVSGVGGSSAGGARDVDR